METPLGSGIDGGNYEYMLTYIAGIAESPASPSSRIHIASTLGDGTIRLLDIPDSVQTRVTGKRVYRRDVVGLYDESDAPYRLFTELAVGVTDFSDDCSRADHAAHAIFDPSAPSPCIYLKPLTVTAKDISDKFNLDDDGNNVTYPGLSITIDATPFTITGDGWLGTIAYVRKGYTGDMTAERCMWQKGLIVNHFGGTLDIWTPMALDDTSGLWIGGFNWVVDTGAVDGGDPDSKANLKRVDVQVRPLG